MKLVSLSRIVLGPPIILIFSLYMLWWHTQEQIDRAKVLASGRDALATITRAASEDTVTVLWTDANGRERAASARTDKTFARLVRETRQNPKQDTKIKYVDEPGIAPVILAQTATRDRINSWWISSSIVMASITGLLCSVFGVAYLLHLRRRRIKT